MNMMTLSVVVLLSSVTLMTMVSAEKVFEAEELERIPFGGNVGGVGYTLRSKVPMTRSDVEDSSMGCACTLAGTWHTDEHWDGYTDDGVYPVSYSLHVVTTLGYSSFMTKKSTIGATFYSDESHTDVLQHLQCTLDSEATYSFQNCEFHGRVTSCRSSGGEQCHQDCEVGAETPGTVIHFSDECNTLTECDVNGKCSTMYRVLPDDNGGGFTTLVVVLTVVVVAIVAAILVGFVYFRKNREDSSHPYSSGDF